MKKIIMNKYILYTLMFWGFIGYLLANIFSLGLCAVGAADAISQHYPIMKHIRLLFLDFFTSLVEGQEYAFPMFEFNLGMGENTIASLN